MARIRGRARAVIVVTIAALLSSSTTAWAAGSLLASARRIASAERLRIDSATKQAASTSTRCGASTAEKIAWLWLLGGGTVMLITGPREQDPGHWYNDSKVEGEAGAASIVISFFLLRDIRRQRAACAP
jgi:hypothetical protein